MPPTLSLRDLAARKTLALFGRAEARDFADVYDLARGFGRDQLLDWAATDDPGFRQPDLRRHAHQHRAAQRRRSQRRRRGPASERETLAEWAVICDDLICSSHVAALNTEDPQAIFGP
jgi:hypothetical protein